ncbi:hypothetical protein KIW84_064416 [Lathyrus oleraceus]|uniref:Zinc knuckle CX2CX4HX4C domain-containing protein n=1 Tax=Pisum sativum TaxID=3888 RepID=A0A9D5A8P7_PEA|nr:hypothetical protein KIW84_064416 [Pisum sativum]
MIGKTMKIDRNTLSREKGKYVRLCIQVNLLKPFLAMFSIKGRHYKIEYEGFHLLCLSYVRFGHNSDGCPIIKDRHSEIKMNNVAEGSDLRATMVKDAKARISGMGSNFMMLGDDSIVNEKENEIEINLPKMDIEVTNQSEEVQLVENKDDNKVNAGKRKVEGSNSLVSRLNIQLDSIGVEKGNAKNEEGSQRIKRKNLDQLGPKTLRAQGDVTSIELEYCPSQPIFYYDVSDKDVPPSAVEQMRDDVAGSSSKDGNVEVEVVEETPKELLGATFLH